MTSPTPKVPLVNAALLSWLLFVAVETTTQIVFKMAGATLDDSAGLVPLIRHALGTPIVFVGFALYFCGFVCWLTILKDVDLGKAFPMTASVYLATLTAAVLLFHETLNPVRILGVVVIIAGVALLASDENSPKAFAGPVP